MSAKHMAPASPRKTRSVRGYIRKILTTLLVIALIAGAGFGGRLLYLGLTTVEVTVNGTPHTARRGDTVEELLEAGLVDPEPGDLLAVDGSVITEGGGERCTVTINGSKGYLSSELSAGDNISIADGADTHEEETVTEEAIPFQTIEGDLGYASYYAGPLHILGKGKNGRRVWRTGDVSGITVTEDSEQPQNAGYEVEDKHPESRVVALTFDDGPWVDTTAQILDILEENDAKATFFTIGEQVAENADVVRRAHDMGCDVFTHTWDHARGSGMSINLALMTPEEQVSEVQRGYDAIKDAIGDEPAHILRAPGGNFYDSVITNLWDLVDVEVGWNIDTEDWKLPGTDAIVSSILAAEPGNVILMHDGGGDRSQTVEALRQALPKLKEQGYAFVTVSELMEM